jgi:hypothetical protein
MSTISREKKQPEGGSTREKKVEEERGNVRNSMS